jgi:uncharacterized membrane protein
MKVRALLLAIVILVAILPSTMSVSAAAEEDRQGNFIKVNMYIHLSTTSTSMDTIPGTGTFRLADQLTFTSVELMENLRVEGVETDVGLHKGFNVLFEVQAQLSDARVTMQVRDDDNVIANKTISISRGATRTSWELPFVDDLDTYQFSKRHQISLRVSADTRVFMRTTPESHLELYCEDHLDIGLETRDIDDRRASSFYPNDLPNQRHIIFQGDLVDPFGATDIAGVNVTIKRPNGQIVVDKQAAEVDGMNYTYDWNYANGLDAGSYTVDVTGRDQQSHEFSITGSFNMADYGVRLSTEGEEAGRVTKSTTPNTDAKYTLTVLNIGGKSAKILMDDGNPLPSWTTSFSKGTFTLGAGDDDDVVFNVKPAISLGGGNSSVFVVSATVSDDPATPQAKDVLEVETFVRDVAAFLVQPDKPDPKTVGVGGKVDHTFTIRNTGENPTDVDLSILSGTGNGWTAEFRGSRVVNNAIEDLRSMEVVEVILRVTAPSTSTNKEAVIKVKVQSHEFTDVFKEITFTTKLVIGLKLTPTTPLSTTQDPGASFVLYFEALNNDPTSNHNITFTVIQRTSTWPSSAFTYTPSTLVRLNSGAKTNMGLEVDVPQTAEAGTPRFTVKGIVDGNDNVLASFDFNVTVNILQELEVELDPPSAELTITTAEADKSFKFLTLTNGGNKEEMVNVTVEVDSDDVIVEINDVRTSILLNLRIGPGASEDVKIAFWAKASAKNGDKITVRISVVRKGDTTPIHPNDFKLVVEKSTHENVVDFFSIFGTYLIMIIAMFVFLVYKPKSRRPEKDKEEEGPKSHHGAVVRH